MMSVLFLLLVIGVITYFAQKKSDRKFKDKMESPEVKKILEEIAELANQEQTEEIKSQIDILFDKIKQLTK